MASRRCDCESKTCHPRADCSNVGTVKTLYSTVCAECAAKLPAKYLANITLHVLTNAKETVRTIPAVLRFADQGIKRTVNFDCPYVTYHVESLRNHKGEWFCIDAAGRNYGTSPHGVYVKTADLLPLLAVRR